MPPHVPRKRHASPPLASTPPSKRVARVNPTRRAKESIFETLDAAPKLTRTLSEAKALLEQEDESSELSSLDDSSDEFEDVEINGNNHTSGRKGKEKAGAQSDGDDPSESEEEEWEDALGSQHVQHGAKAFHNHKPAPVDRGDIEITLSSNVPAVAFDSTANGKKGASKRQRHIRNMTHCMHVQFLMFHNLMRNAWIQDKEVQKIMVQHLSSGCWSELERYWKDAGIPDGLDRVIEGGYDSKKSKLKSANSEGDKKGRGKPEPSTKGKGSKAANKISSSKSKREDARRSDRNQRDWGATSAQLEPNAPNLSSGDPLLRLLKYLAAFWKQKFKITAPCLRKRGYLPPSVLAAETNAWRRDSSNLDNFGERIENLKAFREIAKKCEGSRDVGQQLFTALLRGLGIEARMVASLQPIGFGWTQAEEGKPKKLDDGTSAATATPKKKDKSTPRKTASTPANPNDLESSSSELSELASDTDASLEIISSNKKTTQSRRYGNELPSPTYWTEALSPTSNTPIAVSPLPLSIIAPSSSPDALQNFYIRGAAAEKAKQVFCYLITFSSDGTAKDVTTRYLPRHVWPGKTKGFRVPVEKIPIYNRRGKVAKYEEFDWFKSVLRPYARAIQNQTIWDEIEDEGDLVPAKPTKPKDMDEEGGKETLQGYKNSKEYVLERHLRREEALLPGAKIVRYFTVGKGDKETNEAVYRRKDVVACKTVETWHKEGREVKAGEQPLKFVPFRAVTTARKREIEEREREEGEKAMQGLYSHAQTDWIIPDPIQDGKIPRNAFGNIDVYVPSMIPKGAVHIPLRGTAKICRKLNIDYAEACTGFEFGNKRAVPVLTGVVVAVENEDVLIDAWEAEEVEKRKKEEAKKEKLVLGMWKKFFMGLRIVERMKVEYGDDVEVGALKQDVPAAGSAERKESEPNHEELAGGLLPLSQEPQLEGGFLPPSQESHREGGFHRESRSPDPQNQAGGFIIDHDTDNEASDTKHTQQNYPQTPISLSSAHQVADEPLKLPDNKASEPRAKPSGRSARNVGEEQSRVLKRPLRRSARGVRSRYFEHGSGEETDG